MIDTHWFEATWSRDRKARRVSHSALAEAEEILTLVQGPEFEGLFSREELFAEVSPTQPADIEAFAKRLLHLEKMVRRVGRLEREIVELKEKLEGTERDTKVVVIDIVPRLEARARILDYYNERGGEEIYPSDVAEALRLDAFLVFEISNELEEEGLLK